jgi:hypothetical protein
LTIGDKKGEQTMNRKCIYLLSGALTVLILLSGLRGWTQPRPVAKPPIIIHTFAVEKGNYGYIWKIYIEAEDPEGDMLRIASVVHQPGHGRYPTDWIYLKPQYQKSFRGYVQWNTFSSKAPSLEEWTQITLTLSIIDKAGNESTPVVFPFTFESGVKDQYKYKLPAPFNEGDIPKLGNIFIDLYEPTLMAGNGGDRD